MEFIAIREGCYSELKINFEIANFVFLTTLFFLKTQITLHRLLQNRSPSRLFVFVNFACL